MNMDEETRDLVAFLATLVAIVLLSKIGGTGSDLAIMTGLIGVLGMIAGRNRTKRGPSGTPSDPVSVEDTK